MKESGNFEYVPFHRIHGLDNIQSTIPVTSNALPIPKSLCSANSQGNMIDPKGGLKLPQRGNASSIWAFEQMQSLRQQLSETQEEHIKELEALKRRNEIMQGNMLKNYEAKLVKYEELLLEASYKFSFLSVHFFYLLHLLKELGYTGLVTRLKSKFQKFDEKSQKCLIKQTKALQLFWCEQKLFDNNAVHKLKISVKEYDPQHLWPKDILPLLLDITPSPNVEEFSRENHDSLSELLNDITAVSDNFKFQAQPSMLSSSHHPQPSARINKFLPTPNIVDSTNTNVSETKLNSESDCVQSESNEDVTETTFKKLDENVLDSKKIISQSEIQNATSTVQCTDSTLLSSEIKNTENHEVSNNSMCKDDKYITEFDTNITSENDKSVEHKSTQENQNDEKTILNNSAECNIPSIDEEKLIQLETCPAWAGCSDNDSEESIRNRVTYSKIPTIAPQDMESNHDYETVCRENEVLRGENDKLSQRLIKFRNLDVLFKGAIKLQCRLCGTYISKHAFMHHLWTCSDTPNSSSVGQISATVNQKRVPEYNSVIYKASCTEANAPEHSTIFEDADDASATKSQLSRFSRATSYFGRKDASASQKPTFRVPGISIGSCCSPSVATDNNASPKFLETVVYNNSLPPQLESKSEVRQTTEHNVKNRNRFELIEDDSYLCDRIHISVPSVSTIKNKSGELFQQYRIRISIETTEWNVYRRYREFIKLHNHISKTYKNVFIPSDIIPQRSILFANPVEVASRQTKLERYITEIIRVKKIRDDSVFRKFLEIDLYRGSVCL